ncbi:hypothetical protein EE612_004446, partial [Oryza sativa]
ATSTSTTPTRTASPSASSPTPSRAATSACIICIIVSRRIQLVRVQIIRSKLKKSQLAGSRAICVNFCRVIASGTMPDPGWIAASGTTNLELPVKVPYDFIVSLIKDVSGDWDIDYVLEVGITIDLPVVGSFTIPLATEGEMKLPTFRDLLF